MGDISYDIVGWGKKILVLLANIFLWVFGSKYFVSFLNFFLFLIILWIEPKNIVLWSCSLVFELISLQSSHPQQNRMPTLKLLILFTFDFLLLCFALLCFVSLHLTQFTPLHFTFPSLPFPSLPFPSLHFTSLHFTVLYWNQFRTCQWLN